MVTGWIRITFYYFSKYVNDKIYLCLSHNIILVG